LRSADLIVTRYGEPWFVLLSPARYGFLRLTVATKAAARKSGRTSAKP
jgi:hypothetical protein